MYFLLGKSKEARGFDFHYLFHRHEFIPKIVLLEIIGVFRIIFHDQILDLLFQIRDLCILFKLNGPITE